MASIQVVSSLPLAEQARALTSFLSLKALTVPDETAHALCAKLALSAPRDAKVAVQQLRAELKSHDVQLAQTHGYEAVAKVCGFDSWMRARQAAASRGTELSRDGFAMRLTPVGGPEGAMSPYESLPKVANEIIDGALKRLGKQGAPVFCTLTRGRRGLRVEFEPVDQLGFSFEVVSYQVEGEEVRFVDLDGDAIRGFARRLERALELSRPGIIVSGTVVSSALPHWYHPTYVLRSLRKNAQDVVVGSEAQLFLMLEGFGVGEAARADASRAILIGTDDDIRVDAVWVSQEDETTEARPLTSAQFGSLIERLRRLKRVLREPFSKVMARNYCGAADAKDYFPLDKELLRERRESMGLTLEQLAERAGVPLLDLARIEKYGHAHDSVIQKLAVAVGLGNGNGLLPEEGDQGLGVRLETPEALARAMAGAYLWRCIISESFEGAERTEVEAIAQHIQECGDLAEFGEGAFGAQAKVDTEALTQDIGDAMAELDRLGGAVVVSRSVRYAHGTAQAPTLEGLPMHVVTLFFERVSELRTPTGSKAGDPAAEGGRHG